MSAAHTVIPATAKSETSLALSPAKARDSLTEVSPLLKQVRDVLDSNVMKTVRTAKTFTCEQESSSDSARDQNGDGSGAPVACLLASPASPTHDIALARRSGVFKRG